MHKGNLTSKPLPVVIVGDGIARLACARRLHKLGIAAQLLDASNRVGGHIRTGGRDGYLLDRGFQVLQKAYPEARRTLYLPRLKLRNFAAGAMVRIRGHSYTLADPLRRPLHLWDTLS